MGFSGFVYQATNNEANLTALTPVSDPQFTTKAESVYLPSGTIRLMGAIGLGTQLTAVQVSSPSLRAVVPYAASTIYNADIYDDYDPFVHLANNSILMVEGEEVRVLTTDGGAANNLKRVGVFVSDGNISPVNANQIHSVSGTIDADTAAGEWVNGQIDLDSTLPRGIWAVVGAQVISGSACFARFVFTNNGTRPMVLVGEKPDSTSDPIFRNGALGIWGQFDGRTPPKIELLGTKAGSQHKIVLDLVRVTQ